MSQSRRNALFDSLKGLACAAIVLHHLAFYGPLSQSLAQYWPLLSTLLVDYARMAVQVFLVLAGYLAAASLSVRPGQPHTPPWRWLQQRLGQRYMRLLLPLMAALLLVIGVSELVRPWLDDPMVSAEPNLPQLLAHALLLHGVLGEEALSAGAWYVAIDFQLYAATVLLFAWARQSPARQRWLPATVAVLAAVSLLYFNRDTTWDNWGVYFFGAYGLGLLAYWATQAQQSRQTWLLLAVMATLGAGALLLQWRPRIALATAVALLLVPALRADRLSERMLAWQGGKPLLVLGQTSYSVFLIHFALCLLLNALWAQYGAAAGALGTVLALLLGFALSLLAGQALYYLMERHAPNWLLLLRWQISLVSVGWLLRFVLD